LLDSLLQETKMTQPTDEREECLFKDTCFRKNPHHFREYKHAHLTDLLASHPDQQIENTDDTGDIGVDNLQQQLKIFADVELMLCRRRLSQTNGRSNNVVATGPIVPNVSQINDSFTADQRNGKRSRSPSPTAQVKKRANDLSQPTNSQRAENNDRESLLLSHERLQPQTATASRHTSLQLHKLEAASPYNFFLTKVKDNPATHSDMHSLYLTDLLHPSLGKLKSSLQINFMVDLEWLLMNYEVTKTDKLPLVILYGQDNPELTSNDLQSNIRTIRIKPKYPYGTHHTKMMVLVYEDDSVRVVVHTANLVPSDWENRTQGLWVSPRCAKLSAQNSTRGDSPTQFKSSLLRYLNFYEVSAVKQFSDAISACDMSAVNVFFVASVPNSHRNSDIYKWGHKAVSKILRQHIPEGVGRWPVKVQCSSIGSLGQTPDTWLETELGRSLACHQGASGVLPSSVKVELVYPSHQDVMSSYDGPLGGGCLPYSAKTHAKQPWLIDFLHNWRGEASLRTQAMPHIKTYTRIDESSKKMAFFLLTSANLSKAAWGSMNKAGNSCLIMSYEAGVLFIPKFFESSDEFFNVDKFWSRASGSRDFPLHYDVPVKKYDGKDKPWFYDFLLSR